MLFFILGAVANGRAKFEASSGDKKDGGSSGNSGESTPPPATATLAKIRYEHRPPHFTDVLVHDFKF